ncbi:MAG: TIR domain-containing protein [Rhodococcus sp. (in: high G+C Gram-positive bacteria)]|nr:MAG: TIR domain-containing protein [Rhodococcus sp. (in: high G+C Gram-positive bacteria)]
MAFYTTNTVRSRGLTAAASSRFTLEERRRKAAIAPNWERFDVFLSHSFRDAEEIYGVVAILEDQGLSVYVDWIVDRHLSRGNVTPATAATLRRRMGQCNSLIFAVSGTSSESRWMPWELGLFDGMRGGHIAVMPLLSSASAQSHPGQEYLGLYPAVEAPGGPYGSPTVNPREYGVVASGQSLGAWAKAV